jgi:hypothetical protein
MLLYKMNGHSNYAEINPSLNYNMNVPRESNKFDYYKQSNKSYNNDNLNFSKFQENMKYEGDNYYCGGNSKFAIGGMQIETTPLSKLFFSNENMQRIQNRIKRDVYFQTNKKFKLEINQNSEDLLIVMRAIYLNVANNYPDHVVRQVKILNEKTLEDVVPGIITNLKQQYNYIRDISTQPVPLPPPLNVSSKGRKSLPSPTSVWGF